MTETTVLFPSVDALAQFPTIALPAIITLGILFAALIYWRDKEAATTKSRIGLAAFFGLTLMFISSVATILTLSVTTEGHNKALLRTSLTNQWPELEGATISPSSKKLSGRDIKANSTLELTLKNGESC